MSVYGYRWRRYRLAQLRSEPLCRMCATQGLVVPATVVDHIKRHAGDRDPLFWDSTNLQSLCKRCHDRVKQQIERKGWATGYDVRGLPLYPRP
jgi:5-methylcytosine-specific restriction protein A